MDRLFLLMLTLTVATLAGIGVIVALVMGYYSFAGIIVSAGIGAVLGGPAAWFVARAIRQSDPQHDQPDDAR